MENSKVTISYIGLKEIEPLHARVGVNIFVDDKLNEIIEKLNILIRLKNGEINK